MIIIIAIMIILITIFIIILIIIYFYQFQSDCMIIYDYILLLLLPLLYLLSIPLFVFIRFFFIFFHQFEQDVLEACLFLLERGRVAMTEWRDPVIVSRMVSALVSHIHMTSTCIHRKSSIWPWFEKVNYHGQHVVVLGSWESIFFKPVRVEHQSWCLFVYRSTCFLFHRHTHSPRSHLAQLQTSSL